MHVYNFLLLAGAVLVEQVSTWLMEIYTTLGAPWSEGRGRGRKMSYWNSIKTRAKLSSTETILFLRSDIFSCCIHVLNLVSDDSIGAK